MYIYNLTHNYESMCKIRTNCKQANIISEGNQTNSYSAQLACSPILNSDWSEKVHWSKL